MDVFIALYRGLNVLGKNCVRMESLRAMHERIGHRNVRSYIQSGNIVFAAKGPAQTIAREVAAEFPKQFDFAPKVLIVDSKTLGRIVQSNPYAAFAAERPNTVHVRICDGAPDPSGLNALLARTGGSEAFEIAEGVVYLHAPDGYGKSKFAARMERACGVPMTVRNWRTMEALWKMANTLL